MYGRKAVGTRQLPKFTNKYCCLLYRISEVWATPATSLEIDHRSDGSEIEAFRSRREPIVCGILIEDAGQFYNKLQ